MKNTFLSPTASTTIIKTISIPHFPNYQVENCGDKYVYFLTKSIQNDYCYVADTDVCSEDVYREVNDERRLHYSHKYGTSFTRCEF